jgi:hypothetical protein
VGQLKSDSLLQDLDLVMCMALEWTRSQASHGVRDEDLIWRGYVVGYAKTGKIDLAKSPLQNTSELLTSLKACRRRVGNPRVDRWGWRQKVSPTTEFLPSSCLHQARSQLISQFDQFVSGHGTSDGDWNLTPVGSFENVTQPQRDN